MTSSCHCRGLGGQHCLQGCVPLRPPFCHFVSPSASLFHLFVHNLLGKFACCSSANICTCIGRLQRSVCQHVGNVPKIVCGHTVSDASSATSLKVQCRTESMISPPWPLQMLAWQLVRLMQQLLPPSGLHCHLSQVMVPSNLAASVL